MVIPASQSGAKSERKYITISSDTANYNLANDLTNNYGWNGTSPIDAQVTINPGVSVSATATTAPAFHADLVSGSTLVLDNHGVIVGKGGSSGSAGGHAISLQDVAATINNIPARNLLSKSEALGDWSFTGSPTVTANAVSKNIYKHSEAPENLTLDDVIVTTDAIAKPVPGNLQVYPVPTNSTWSKTGSATITDNQDYNPINGEKNVSVIALGAAEQIYDNTALNGAKELTGSVWLWVDTADVGKTVRIYIRDATNSAWSSAKTVTLTANPTRHSLGYTPASSAASGGVRLYGAPGVTLTTLRAYGVQLIEGSEPTDFATGPNGTENIIVHPENLNNWTKSHTTVVTNALVAPDGTRTMDTIEVEAGATYIWGNRGTWFNVDLSSLYSVSVYLKHSGTNRTLINLSLIHI